MINNYLDTLYITKLLLYLSFSFYNEKYSKFCKIKLCINYTWCWLFIDIYTEALYYKIYFEDQELIVAIFNTYIMKIIHSIF